MKVSTYGALSRVVIVVAAFVAALMASSNHELTDGQFLTIVFMVSVGSFLYVASLWEE